ncbi:MAG: PLP-dependent aminotransferase family protein [Myxococcales bacterium]|nr:PLP-dependent aminotransferase family protein [Myxococcales bacterium]
MENEANDNPFLYQQVIALVERQIQVGTLRPGDRLPSLRSLSHELEVSVPTVRQAYLELERRHYLEARPKSGYFLKPQLKPVSDRQLKKSRSGEPIVVRCRELIDEIYEGVHRPGVLPLGVANPTMANPATKMLHRALRRVAPRAEERLFVYAPTNGDAKLRRQLAYRYFGLGVEVDPDAIVITNGAQEAISLALQAVASPGDVIAVESPTYHGQLELIESLGLLALEVETCPQTGVDVDALETILATHSVAACLFSAALNNPLGSLMPEDSRERMVRLLEKRQVPLIEDDVYGELIFEGSRPHPGQYYARDGWVITCSSFSKTLAPGYRIGWILPGRFGREIVKRKRAFSCATGLLPQLALSDILGSGDFERYLRRLVPVLSDNAKRMACAVSCSFPSSTRFSCPQGGSVLWVEVPGIDSVDFFRLALEANVSIVPGTVFAARNRYRSCFRISYGHPWSDRVEAGIQSLAEIARNNLQAT